MKKLLNTLFVLSEDSYVALDGENVIVLSGDSVLARYPLHTLQSIVCFSYKGASPALMGKCARMQIGLNFFTPSGRFLARTCGESQGNVLLRRTQYRMADDPRSSCELAKAFIVGKIYNARWQLERATRDHPDRVNIERLKEVSRFLAQSIQNIAECSDMEQLRGYEGEAAHLPHNSPELFRSAVLHTAENSPIVFSSFFFTSKLCNNFIIYTVTSLVKYQI